MGSLVAADCLGWLVRVEGWKEMLAVVSGEAAGQEGETEKV